MYLLHYLLNALFPPSPSLQKIQGLSLSDFIKNTSPAKPPDRPYFFALFNYKNSLVRDTVWLLKYRGNKKAIHLCAEALHDFLLEEVLEEHFWESGEKTILVPIPMSKKHLRERGFNQTLLLADEIVSLDSGEHFEVRDDVCAKIKETKMQTKCLSRNARLQNVRGSFGIENKNEVVGKNIVVIDDVTTTGATLEEVRRVFLDAGAKSVFCIAIAH